MLLYNDSVDRSVCCLSALCCVVWYPDLFVCLLACLLLTPEFCDISQPTHGIAISQRTGRTEPITKPCSALKSRPPTTKATSVRGVPEAKTNPVWVELEVGSMHRVEVELVVCWRRSCVLGLLRQSCGTCIFRLAHTRCADEFAGVLVCVIALWWRSFVLLHEGQLGRFMRRFKVDEVT